MITRTFLHNLADGIGLAIVAALLAVLLAFGIGFGPGTFTELNAPEAGKSRSVEFHGNLPNVGGGQDGARYNANPNDDQGGIHNIAGIKDRQGRNGGTPPACTAHGGLGAANQNCN